MQIILLAAGRGSRLGNSTAFLPKTLLPVGGKPLCHHILDSLKSYPIRRIVVIGGFQSEELFCALSSYGERIHFIKNPHFTEGNLVSLLCAKDHLGSPFFIMNADHLYDRSILGKIFNPPRSAITAFCDFDRLLNDDDMKVKLKDGKTVEIMAKNLKTYDGGYVGITHVPLEKTASYLERAAEVLSHEGRKASVESVLNCLALKGEKIDAFDVSGSSWFEIDTPQDLERAREMIKKPEFACL